MYIVAGTHRHRKIITPKGQATRPTTSRMREALFNICQNYIEKARFLDLFAGSGAMGLEALSRGAESTTFIDSGKESIRCVRENLQTLGLENQGQAIQGDVFIMAERLAKQGKQFDIIFADAPYDPGKEAAETFSQRLVRLIDKSDLLAPSGMLFIEQDSRAHQILEEELHTLAVVSSRQMGKATLCQYQKKCQ